MRFKIFVQEPTNVGMKRVLLVNETLRFVVEEVADFFRLKEARYHA